MMLTPLAFSLLLADPLPQLEPPVADTTPAAVRFVDVTGDGVPDKLMLGADGSLHVAVHLWGRQYRLIEQLLPRVLVQDVLVSDLDGDGSVDLYLVSPGGNVALTGDGTGYFELSTARLGLIDAGKGLSAERLDLDGDGLADLLLHNVTSDVLFWARADGTFDRDADSPAASPTATGGAGTGTSMPTTSDDDNGAGADATPSGPGGGSAPAPTGSQSVIPSAGSLVMGPTLGDDLRVGGARSDLGVRGPTVPVSIPSVLDDAYVNDDAGEVGPLDIVDGSLSGGDISTWIGDVTLMGGNVGIGVSNPQRPLDVAGDIKTDGAVLLFKDGRGVVQNSGTVEVGSYANVADGGWYGTYSNHPLHFFTNNSSPQATLTTAGDFVVGGEVQATGVQVGGVDVSLGAHTVDTVGTTSWTDGSVTVSTPQRVEIDKDGRGLVQSDGTVEVGTYIDFAAGAGWYGTYSAHPLKFFTNNGQAGATLRLDQVFEVKVLEITGGSDIVERFETDGEELEPGTLVVIDPEHQGKLMASGVAYDRKVAGIVSGAGGVNPGLCLGQEGTLDGDVQVAMTGRVYVKCSTENGAIAPGDRLTTSNLTGHAMKATDADRWDGSVIGKAMSSLDEATGLVLVLVNLQ